jgi:hypothetical protein
MILDKLTQDRLISISDTIKYIAETDKQHLPDKIGSLMINISLIELEIKKLKELCASNGG